MLELVNIYLMTQSRAKNIPLFLIFRFQLDQLRKTLTMPHPHQCSNSVFNIPLIPERPHVSSR